MRLLPLYSAAGLLALCLGTLSISARTPFQVQDPESPLHRPAFTVPSALTDTGRVPVESHSGPLPYESWLQHTLNFTHLAPVIRQLEWVHPGPLLNRGEAHVTVVTPPEFDRILAPVGITVADLDALALQAGLQHVPFKVLCVGRQRLVSPEKAADTLEAYNLIVQADAWLDLRWDIWRLFVQRSGEPSAFDPAHFWPHITLGYSHRDLFVEDGMYKGINSCWRPVEMTTTNE
ncbi:hypothetical protein H4R33_000155 [Dimargaris cristalligena]|nr:hypothetical protein H4R33_000155 [Dimargaris cristalligena]